jgi:hypothetical protein
MPDCLPLSRCARNDDLHRAHIRLAPLCASDVLSERLQPLFWRLLDNGVGPVRKAAAYAAAPILRSLRYRLGRTCAVAMEPKYLVLPHRHHCASLIQNTRP